MYVEKLTFLLTLFILFQIKFKIDFVADFKQIIELSNSSIVNRDAKTFWNVRYKLDEQLRVLTQSVENSWFGPFKGFFLGKIDDQKFVSFVEYSKQAIISEASRLELENSDNLDLLELVLESYVILSSDDLGSAFALLFNCYSYEFIRSCLKICEVNFSKAFPIDIENKADIASLLCPSPVGLVLNKHLEQFPFESLPSLLHFKQEMFRVPSLLFLSAMMRTFREKTIFIKGADGKSAFYLLNPTDNLGKTEDMFKSRFTQEKNWNGVIGRHPTANELSEAFTKKDIYIFFGHGAGSSYYRLMPDNLEGLAVHSASLVIGCSSGRLMADGPDLESYGTPYRFLTNGAPCYVGVLWDVTDRDIDKYSDRMLSKWLPNWTDETDTSVKHAYSITRSCIEAREACKLKYLIGAAPVVYGLPVHAFIKDTLKQRK